MHLFPSYNFRRPDTIKDTLYVITTVFNPHRYRSRWKLYKEFEKYVLASDEAHLVTIECTFGEREKVLLESISHKHTVVHVQTTHELWLKENCINRAIQALPENWKYMAWIDADIKFARPDWVGETLHKLQHYDVVQMFSEAIDLGPNYEVLNKHKGFVWSYTNQRKVDKTYSGWHPGFAWAATRRYINTVGGLFEHSILGAGDRNMATALIGRLEDSIPLGLHCGYMEELNIWAERAALIKKNIGFMEGVLLHYWHGAKKHRRYKERWQILIENQYNPKNDLKKDWQGIFQLTEHNPKLRDEIRGYFSQRNEDSIDL